MYAIYISYIYLYTYIASIDYSYLDVALGHVPARTQQYSELLIV